MSPHLTQRREHLLRIARNIVPKNRPLTESERQSFSSLQAEMLELETAIHSDASRRSSEAFNSWLAHGLSRTQFQPRGGISESEKAALSTLALDRRDMGTGAQGAYPAASTGFFAPLDFDSQVVSAMKDVGSMLKTSTVMQTNSGNLLFVPSNDDRAISGERIVENSQFTDEDVSNLNATKLSTFKYSSRMVKCSIEFLQDAAPDVPAWLASQFGIRLGRVVNTDTTIGTGNTMPTGLANAVTVGVAAVGSGPNDGSNPSLTNFVGHDDLTNLVESVDPLYRNAPGAGFVLNDNTLSQIQKLTDKLGHPLNLYKSALESPSGVATLMGHACFTNPNMPTLQASPSSPQVSVRSVLFGDLSRYRIRKTAMLVQRISEKYAEYGQIAFLCTLRLDGALIDGSVGQGTGFAVKALTNSY